jgi:hypothetical protein
VKAITIRQPWAYAVIYMGKDIENRTWSTKHRGPLLVHAAKSMAVAEYEAFCKACETLKLGIPPPMVSLKPYLGGVVGIVDLVDVVEKSRSKWFQGPFGFELKNAKPLPFRSMPGKLGLFDVPN